jgi:hypothetical protein
VYQSLLHISWVDKLLENVRALFTELYREQLSTPRRTTISYPFEPYFERQIQELEKTEGAATVSSVKVATSGTKDQKSGTTIEDLDDATARIHSTYPFLRMLGSRRINVN